MGTRAASYDPGRIKDRFAMVGGNLTAKKIQLLNAKEWKKKNFNIAEDEIASINQRNPFDFHICESNNQGWHVIDNLRTLKDIPVIPINTSNNLKDDTARKGKSLDKNNMVEWIEWARKEDIIEFPAGQWSPGITELNRQLNRFVMKRTSTGYKYEAAEPDDHDDLVMALVILCHFARMRILKLGDQEDLPLGVGAGSRVDFEGEGEEDEFTRQIKQRMESNGMNASDINSDDDW